MTTIEDAIAAYADFFAGLTPDRLGELRELANPDMIFRDPFNDIQGVERVIGMFEHMFETVSDVDFSINHQAAGTNVGFIGWDFHFKAAYFGAQTITGASEIRFDERMRVAAHIDHWDAAGQLYEKLPLLGRCVKGIRRRLAYPG